MAVKYREDYWNDIGSGIPVDGPHRTKQPMCLYCQHLDPAVTNDNPTCKAFPDGIPSRFWDAKADHTAPYEGDKGITFTPKAS